MFQVRQKDHPTEVGKPTLYAWLVRYHQKQEPLWGSPRVSMFFFFQWGVICTCSLGSIGLCRVGFSSPTTLEKTFFCPSSRLIIFQNLSRGCFNLLAPIFGWAEHSAGVSKSRLWFQPPVHPRSHEAAPE